VSLGYFYSFSIPKTRPILLVSFFCYYDSMWPDFKIKITTLLVVFIILLTTGLGCKGGQEKKVEEALSQPVTMEFWGVFDTHEAFSQIIANYQASRPNVTIKYRKLRFEEYEQALLNAWAEGRGPDVFMVHNTWTTGYQAKITPLPELIKVPTVEVSGGLQKTKTYSFYEARTPTVTDLNRIFVPVVANDAIKNDQVYGLPLSVDTMVLFYNRSLLDQAGLPQPPSTWQELINVVPRLTTLDSNNQISKAAAGLGGATNIDRNFDIVSLLMAQNGVIFRSDQGGQIDLSGSSDFRGRPEYSPGQQALRFYTDFASPVKETYTWSEDLPNAMDMFIQGRLAMMLGYAFQLPLIKAQGPKIDLGINTVPHINADGTDALGTTINWANYWLLSVARGTTHPSEAWDFILFATTQPEQANTYLSKSVKPTALRTLITSQLEHQDLSIFASQLLTAQSWYQGRNAIQAETVFGNMILSVTQGLKTPADALKDAENQINISY
jgi:ABC-type glycerol-3-phosphate transport system substrate-binding protein